jgi:hypothetical protein
MDTEERVALKAAHEEREKILHRQRNGSIATFIGIMTLVGGFAAWADGKHGELGGAQTETKIDVQALATTAQALVEGHKNLDAEVRRIAIAQAQDDITFQQITGTLNEIKAELRDMNTRLRAQEMQQ